MNLQNKDAVGKAVSGFAVVISKSADGKGTKFMTLTIESLPIDVPSLILRVGVSKMEFRLFMSEILQ